MGIYQTRVRIEVIHRVFGPPDEPGAYSDSLHARSPGLPGPSGSSEDVLVTKGQGQRVERVRAGGGGRVTGPFGSSSGSVIAGVQGQQFSVSMDTLDGGRDGSSVTMLDSCETAVRSVCQSASSTACAEDQPSAYWPSTGTKDDAITGNVGSPDATLTDSPAGPSASASDQVEPLLPSHSCSGDDADCDAANSRAATDSRSGPSVRVPPHVGDSMMDVLGTPTSELSASGGTPKSSRFFGSTPSALHLMDDKVEDDLELDAIDSSASVSRRGSERALDFGPTGRRLSIFDTRGAPPAPGGGGGGGGEAMRTRGLTPPPPGSCGRDGSRGPTGNESAEQYGRRVSINLPGRTVGIRGDGGGGANSGRHAMRGSLSNCSSPILPSDGSGARSDSEEQGRRVMGAGASLASLPHRAVMTSIPGGNQYHFQRRRTLAAEDTVSMRTQSNEVEFVPGDENMTVFVIVDDQHVNVLLLRYLLRGVATGAVVTASDGEQAVRSVRNMLESGTPGCNIMVFMDLHMPVMDGFVATRKIRQLEARQGLGPVCICVLTADATGASKSKALEAGANMYHHKPLRQAILRSVLRQSPVSSSVTAAGRRASAAISVQDVGLASMNSFGQYGMSQQLASQSTTVIGFAGDVDVGASPRDRGSLSASRFGSAFVRPVSQGQRHASSGTAAPVQVTPGERALSPTEESRKRRAERSARRAALRQAGQARTTRSVRMDGAAEAESDDANEQGGRR